MLRRAIIVLATAAGLALSAAITLAALPAWAGGAALLTHVWMITIPGSGMILGSMELRPTTLDMISPNFAIQISASSGF